MSTPLLILRELGHRRLNAILSVIGLAAAVALLVVTRMLTDAGERETRRVVQDLGFNLRIIPREADPARFFSQGYVDETLPEDAAKRLAAGSGTFLSFNHLTATLERRIRVGGHDAILSGTSPAIVGGADKKQPMGFAVGAGRIHAGHLIAARLGLKAGTNLSIAERTLIVEKVLVESGTDDDIRLFTSLGDAQAIARLPGRISEIKAIDCLCLTADEDPLGKLRSELSRLLPEGQVLQMRTMADARARLGLKAGTNLTLAERTLTVEKVLVESGTDDDIRLFTSLGDAQAIAGLPGRISEIKAIDCLCLTADQDPLGKLRSELTRLLPEGQVLQMRTMADARARQRRSAERFAALAQPVVVAIGGAWVGLLAILNVRERRPELGLWRALGWGSGRIAWLFLGRAVVLGLAGALIGYAAGTATGLHFGPGIYPVTAGGFKADTVLLGWALLFTPALAALAAFLPAMFAVGQDPADTLRAD